VAAVAPAEQPPPPPPPQPQASSSSSASSPGPLIHLDLPTPEPEPDLTPPMGPVSARARRTPPPPRPSPRASPRVFVGATSAPNTISMTGVRAALGQIQAAARAEQVRDETGGGAHRALLEYCSCSGQGVEAVSPRQSPQGGCARVAGPQCVQEAECLVSCACGSVDVCVLLWPQVGGAGQDAASLRLYRQAVAELDAALRNAPGSMTAALHRAITEKRSLAIQVRA
jgi:hypothetical protein